MTAKLHSRGTDDIVLGRLRMPAEYSLDCLVGATSRIGEEHRPVSIMIRLENECSRSGYGLGDGQVSGWILMSGEDIEDPRSVEFYFLRHIIKHDSTILPYITRAAPCKLVKDAAAPLFYEVDPD